jgi:two-component system, cell cycle sensor histidine kinase and response regulator CckA
VNPTPAARADEPGRILIVEDDPVVLKVLGKLLQRPRRELLLAASAAEAQERCKAGGPDVALVDKNLGAQSGFDVCRALKAADPAMEFLLITGYASIEAAVEALRLGAFDFIQKPVADFEGLNLKLENALEKVRLRRDNRRMADQLEKVRQSQKMEAIGRLAGGVAHDFNNLLSVILCSAQLLGDHLGPSHSSIENVQEIMDAVQRSVALTRQLLTFSREDAVRPQRLGPAAAVEPIAKLMRRTLGERIELAVNLPPTLPEIVADPNQLGQVIVNLGINARDAMPDGGRLTLGGKAVAFAEAHLSSNGTLPPGGYVDLTVEDTGTGMPPEVLARIFEPFFTTKEPGKGTGLGLANVWSIVSQAGGGLEVESAVGRGTTFHVLLPVAAAAQAAATDAEVEAAVQGRGETVLVVEDDEAVRGMVVRLLSSSGYQVVDGGPAGEQALEASARHPGRIDLLVSDLVLPGIAGRQLARRLLERRPELRILFMTGYPEARDHGDDGPLPRPAQYVRKPFSSRAFLQQLRELMNAPAAAPAA